MRRSEDRVVDVNTHTHTPPLGVHWLSACASQDREHVMPLMIRGFRDAAEEGGTSVTGGQTVINPWIIIGGVASVVCQPNEFIM